MYINSAWKKPEFQLAQRTSLSHILLAQSQCSIVFKLMTRCSKISWFFSGEKIFRLRQIIVLRDTDKSQYFAITEFNNYCFIIRSPSLFFNEYLWETKQSAIFHVRMIARRRKVWFHLRVSRILFAASQTWLDNIAHE